MAGVIGGSESIGGSSTFGQEPEQIPSLGRISGKLLSENLIRNGIDLAFDTDLLYLKVAPSEETRIGINVDSPGYDLEINSDILTSDLIVTNDSYINNFYISDNRISTTVGNIEIFTTGVDGLALFDKLSSDNLIFDGNVIRSYTDNSNIIFNPSGTGSINLRSDTNVTGNLNVSGEISLDGDLRTNSNIIIGDEPTDIVVIETDLTQDINPGTTLLYNLGSATKRWAEAHISDWTPINNIIPDIGLISEQMYIGGPSNQITTVLSNEDLVISPDTGVSFIEQIKIEGNIITNLVQTPALDPVSISNGILNAVSGSVIEKTLWIDNTVTGIEEIVTGPGSTADIPRVASLGDIRNDLDNINVVNSDDAQKILDIGLGTGSSTNNEQRWYHTVIKPYIFDDPVLYTQYGNGNGLDNTPITLAHTGIGYLKFSTDTVFRMPAGTTAQRQYLEIGETRWNTDLEFLECFDGDTYIVATGPGAVVTNELMIDLAISRALTFG